MRRGRGRRELPLVERLFAQIQRVAQINEVTTLTPELVAAVQESLDIGTL